MGTQRRRDPRREGDSHVHDPLEGISPGGFIVTGVSPDRIVETFRPVLDDATAAIGRIRPGVSLYLYGSVSTGMARPLVSDVDLLAIGLPEGAAGEMSLQLTRRFDHLCRAVTVGDGRTGHYEGDGDEAYGNRVFLRHYCAHLSGPDPRQSLPDFPADVAAARGFNGDIGRHAQHWRTELDAGAQPETLYRRVGRKSLFAVSGLVSVHDSTWTTDRRSAAVRWAEIDPSLEEGLGRLFAWGEGRGAPSATDLDRVLNGAVADIVTRFDSMIGLWAEPPHASP